MTTTGSPRRQDLDLMRAAVVGGLIFFHTARIFDPLDFYVKDQPPNLPLTLFVFFAGLWGMPLLFVVSGLGAWYSLRSRTVASKLRWKSDTGVGSWQSSPLDQEVHARARTSITHRAHPRRDRPAVCCRP